MNVAANSPRDPESAPRGPGVPAGTEPSLLVQVEPASAELESYLVAQTTHPLWCSTAWAGPLALYGLHWRAVVAREAGTGSVVGGLPLVHQRSLLFGRRSVSLPWVDAAGVVANSPAVAARLVEAAVRELTRAGTTRLDLRQDAPLFDWPVERNDKLAMQLELPADPEQLWKAFDPKVRNQVRKAEKSGIVVESNPPDGLSAFYEVYSTNMRDLGSPPHSRAFFERIQQAFPGVAEIHVARVAGRPVGAGWTMRNRTRLDIPWASSLQEFNKLCVNHGLYWHILRHACLTGHNLFYFGRSTRDSGPHHFKRQWGSVEVPLYWYGLDRSGTPLTSTGTPQESFGLAIRLWQRLPVGIARWLGPVLISRLQ